MVMIALLAAALIPSTPDLGTAAGRCRPNESGPSFLIHVVGLKDRQGNLKAEVYPDNNKDFLQDDNILVSEGKTFRRVVIPVTQSGPVVLCIRVPERGPYALSLMHDRNANNKMNLSSDGVGFPGDPHLCWSQPKANEATAVAGNGPTPITITMQYRHGLFCFSPLKKK